MPTIKTTMDLSAFPFQRLTRAPVVLSLAVYVLIMGALFREELRVTTLGDSLALKRREVDAQLVQNGRDIQQMGKKRNDFAVDVLKDERHSLNAQGVQITQEVEDWQVQRQLWTGMFWAGFVFAHVAVMPFLLWAISVAYPQGGKPTRAKRTSPSGAPRKRSSRTRSAPKSSELVEGSGA